MDMKQLSVLVGFSVIAGVLIGYTFGVYTCYKNKQKQSTIEQQTDSIRKEIQDLKYLNALKEYKKLQQEQLEK